MSVPRGRPVRPPSSLPADAARLPCSAADRVLLVGEGDLSFALALARALGTGANLVATTYDAEAELREMYAPWVARTLRDLRGLGAAALHGVDATRLHEPALRSRLDPAGAGFRLVVWNHPHAGFPAEPHGPGFEQVRARGGPRRTPAPARAPTVCRPPKAPLRALRFAPPALRCAGVL